MIKRMSALVLAAALTVSSIPMGVHAEDTILPEQIVEEQQITLATQSKTSGFSSNYTLSGDPAADMAAIALAQEGRTGSDIGYTEEWCANFIGDCALLAGQADAVPVHSLASTLYQNVLSAGGQVVTGTPKVGDLCFINWSEGSSIGHVEVVYAVSGSEISTIGGNSGSGDSLYTRTVKKHAPLASKYIVEIVRPAYNAECKHVYQKAVVDPTCTEQGYTVYTCSECGYVYHDDFVAAVAHNNVNGVCSFCGTDAPAVPEIVSCYSKEQTSVKVTWNPVSEADGYELWRTSNPDDAASWVLVKTLTSGETVSYTNQALEPGVTYYYKLRAFTADASDVRLYSDFSEVRYMPAAVLFDSPYSNSTSRIRLRWDAVDGAHGYQIWCMDENGSWRIAKTLGDKSNVLTDDQGHVEAYSHTDLTAGATYTYKMRAFTILDNGSKIYGAYSDVYSIAVKPEAPVITVTSTNAGCSQITWDAVNGAAGYQVWMAESADGAYSIVKSVTDGAVTYTKYDLESGKTYFFKVRAYTEAQGRKAFSAFSAVCDLMIR